jgi:hypothetical protein
MSVSVSKVPLFTSGPISFSSLRNSFKGSSSGPIRVSELLRNTSSLETNAIVPDATENEQISSSVNWRSSQLRGAIKEYNLTQTGTDLNLDIDSQSWNGNLGKNISKKVYLNGTCGSNDPSSPSVTMNATSYNLTVDVSGDVLGAAGRGGGTGSGAPNISGQNGGSAMSIFSSGGQVNVVVRSGSRIYAGGGGGERGRNGNRGNNGRCRNETSTSGCGNAGGCPGGYNTVAEWSGGCCQSTCDWCWGCCERCVNWMKYKRCVQEYTTQGGAGGIGGTGGLGRGYNNQSGSLSGASGSSGSGGGGCGAGSGQNGETGASGGEWGISGSNTNNSGNGGSTGAAVFGSNFVVSGTINPSTIKGSYR